MNISSKNNRLDSSAIFELLDKSKKQYEDYLTIVALSHEYKSDCLCKSVNRDINHPLNIIIK